MKEYKTIALNAWVAARETNSGRIMLYTPSDQTEEGHYIPSSEIYLTTDEILKLAEAFNK